MGRLSVVLALIIGLSLCTSGAYAAVELNLEENISPAPEEAYLSAHPEAFRKQVYISPLGEIVRLDNGSEWTINPSSSDREKVKQWMTSNVIIVVPNDTWFSKHQYALVNLSTDDYIEANWISRPIYGGNHDFWISTIDPEGGRLRLNDGSMWHMSFLDKDIIKKWMVGDTIMIGINNGWFNSYNPNILINFELDDFAHGKCHSNY